MPRSGASRDSLWLENGSTYVSWHLTHWSVWVSDVIFSWGLHDLGRAGGLPGPDLPGWFGSPSWVVHAALLKGGRRGTARGWWGGRAAPDRGGKRREVTRHRRGSIGQGPSAIPDHAEAALCRSPRRPRHRPAPRAAPPTVLRSPRPAGLRRAGPADLGGRGRRPARGSRCRWGR